MYIAPSHVSATESFSAFQTSQHADLYSFAFPSLFFFSWYRSLISRLNIFPLGVLGIYFHIAVSTRFNVKEPHLGV